MGLYTNCVPVELPPHSTPSRRTPPPDWRNTSEPESPPPTPALTKFWQMSAMLDPDTPVVTQVFVIAPAVQPVVRPTLFATSPTTSPPSPLIENKPAIVRDPLLAPVVCAIPPSVNATPLAYAARDASDKRHFRPLGQPGMLRR